MFHSIESHQHNILVNLGPTRLILMHLPKNEKIQVWVEK